MSKAWTDKSEFKRLFGELAATDGRVFERAVLPLLRMAWPSAVGAPALRSFDRMGIDHLVWSDAPPFPLIVQCKGFQVHERELGSGQVQSCLDSIRSFSRAKLKAKAYILVHNRPGNNEAFRNPVLKALADLESSGLVERAELWDLQRVLKEAFNSMLNYIKKAIQERHLSIVDVKDKIEPDICKPLEAVPFAVSELKANQYKLVSQSEAIRFCSDPSAEILSTKQNLSIVIGEAGFGKTTAAIRTFLTRDRQILYVPAAIISDKTISTKQFIEQCIDIDTLLADVAETDQPTMRQIARPVLAYILKNPDIAAVLVLDGVDESVYLSRRGGIQNLLNILREVRIPIVLLIRTELWNERQNDFGSSFGDIAQHPERKNQRIKLIELLPWSDDEIYGLALRYRNMLETAEERLRVDTFINTIRNGEYHLFYGDIPRRPLFLRFILETTAQKDAHKVGRAVLFQEWAEMKIRRDVAAPMIWGSVGRLPLVSPNESTESVMYLAFRAMSLAAYHMTQKSNGSLELVPFCEVSRLLKADPDITEIRNPTGLFLNSLLIPVPKVSGVDPQNVRFAHRAYQEFFLARYLIAHPDIVSGLQIPQSVTDWIIDIKAAAFETGKT